MAVTLCVDWGNTNVHAAIFDNNELKQKLVLSNEQAIQQIGALKVAHGPERSILCSVANQPESIETLLKEGVKGYIKLDSYTRTPVSNAYSSPETLGADRLALVVAANSLFPDKNNLVVSAGTCITYNLVQKSRTFRGGAIAPGLQMRLKAMHEYTDRLPLVDVDGTLVLLGYDTETGIRSGAAFGMAAEIDGMVAAYEAAYPEFNAILTGGDAPFFAGKLKSKIFADPDLLLKGLNIISNYNASMFG